MMKIYLQSQAKLRNQYKRIQNKSRKLSYNIVKSKEGLFAIPGLENPDDFIKLSKNAIQKIEDLRNLISSLGSHQPKSTLLVLDRVSNEICSIIDAAELCRNLHPDSKFRDAAEDSFSLLSSTIHELNNDNRLYSKLMEVYNCNQDLFTQEDLLFMKDLKNEFESDGIHIQNPDKKLYLTNLKDHITQLESSFMRNSIDADQHTYEIGPIHTKEYYFIKKWISEYIDQSNLPSKYIRSSSNKSISNSLLTSFQSTEIRKQIWTKTHNHPIENTNILCDLVTSRHAYAQELGFSSYAAKVLQNKVISTTENVWKFLGNISEKTSAKTDEEIFKLQSTLSSFSSTTNKPSSSSMFTAITQSFISKSTSNTIESIPTLQPWDVAYLMSVTHERKTSTSTQRQSALHRLPQYFPLNKAMDGLSLIIYSLFNIQLQLEPFSQNESWFPNTNDVTNNTNHTANTTKPNHHNGGGVNNSGSLLSMDPFISGVFKYRLRNCVTGEDLGVVYMDAYVRQGKLNQAAHFTVRCGCSNSSDDVIDREIRGDHSHTEQPLLLNRHNVQTDRHHDRHHSPSSPHHPSSVTMTGSHSHSDSNSNEHRQIPVVALVFGIHTSGHIQPGEGPLLSLHELETLYHEWGHALHSILSRTTYQHLSGTRGGTDFVEVPSHLMEYFARCPQVVRLWARHHITGEPIPSGLLEEALEQKRLNGFPGIELQTQLLYSVADQCMFGPDLGGRPTLTFQDIQHEVARVQKQFTRLPVATAVEGYHAAADIPSIFLPSHTHLVNYGGSYYAYLFARMHAAQIWRNKFRSNPLSREAGLDLWTNMLAYGSSKPGSELLEAMGGGTLRPDCYLDDFF